MNAPKIKFCGMTRREDVLLAARLGIDFLGLIFAKSPRQISVEQAKCIVCDLTPTVGLIGVFVDESPATILSIVDEVGLTGVQLHGHESSDYLTQLRAARPDLLIIKCIELDESQALPDLSGYACDFFLFDSPRDQCPRKTPDFNQLRQVRTSRPYFVAGQLNSRNVSELVTVLGPYAVDVSSGIEFEPGIKSPEAMHSFVSALRGTTK